MDRERLYCTTVRGWDGGAREAFPWRTSSDAYEVLVGEVLLQRTRGEHVVPVFEEFIGRWPNIEALARARRDSLAKVIRPLGLSKRAVQLQRLGRSLAAKGHVGDQPNELAELPGVGPYVAHAVPVMVHRRNLPLVDWVIARVLRRYFGRDSDKRPNADRELWALAERLANYGDARRLWLGTLDFAASVCKPRPLCDLCPLRKTCVFANSLESVSISP